MRECVCVRAYVCMCVCAPYNSLQHACAKDAAAKNVVKTPSSEHLNSYAVLDHDNLPETREWEKGMDLDVAKGVEENNWN